MGEPDTWQKIQELRLQHAVLMRRLKRRRPREDGEELSSLPSGAKAPIDPALERRLLGGLLNPMLEFPLPAQELCRRVGVKGVGEGAVHQVLSKFAAQVLKQTVIINEICGNLSRNYIILEHIIHVPY